MAVQNVSGDVWPKLPERIRGCIAQNRVPVFCSYRSDGPGAARVIGKRNTLGYAAPKELGNIWRILPLIIARDGDPRHRISATLPKATRVAHGEISLVFVKNGRQGPDHQ